MEEVVGDGDVSEPGVVERGPKFRAPVALDVLDQDEDVGLEVDERVDDGGRDAPRPGLVADVQGDDAEHTCIMPGAKLVRGRLAA